MVSCSNGLRVGVVYPDSLRESWSQWPIRTDLFLGESPLRPGIISGGNIRWDTQGGAGIAKGRPGSNVPKQMADVAVAELVRFD